VRKAGARLRITTQLIDASDGYQVWSKRVDRDMDDVFAIQDQIAATVAAELQGEIGTPAAEPRSTRPTSNLEAYDAYLRGLHAMNRWTEAWVERAVLSFEKAIRLDPAYAPAHAALAECLVWFYAGIGTRPARRTVPRAQEAARKALELGPDLAESHKVAALLAMSHDWDRAAAEKGFLRAIALNPGSADARVWNGWRLALLEGAYESALAELKVAEGLDPLDLKIKTQIGYVHYFLRDYLSAEIQFRRVLALDSNFAFAHYALGDVYAQQRKYAEAVWSLQESMRLGGSTVNHLAIVAHVHALSGRTPDAHALLAEIREKAIQGQASPIWVALVHIGLGEHDLAFEWLDRAFEEKDGSLILVAASPEFDPLRPDARFRALLDRMGLGHRVS
jgi:tetratricopeptide (TPR) repeat protein